MTQQLGRENENRSCRSVVPEAGHRSLPHVLKIRKIVALYKFRRVARIDRFEHQFLNVGGDIFIGGHAEREGVLRVRPTPEKP